MSEKIAVIGAGIVGMSCALALSKDGHAVALIDPNPIDGATAAGSACGVVTGSIAPQAMPGALKQVPAMLLDPLGPLVIRWSYLPRLLPYLLRFLAASRPQRVEEILQASFGFSMRTDQAWRDLVKEIGLEDILRPVGWFKVFDSDKSFAGTAADRAIYDRFGVPYDLLNAEEIRQTEPNLAGHFVKGWMQPLSAQVLSPRRVVQRMAEVFKERGGQIRQDRVTHMAHTSQGWRLELTGNGLEVDKVVLAAGAWSAQLLRPLGLKVPLETERGYHIMLPKQSGLLRRQVVNADHSFVLVPHEDGIRITSQVEFAGLKAPPDYRRIRSLLPEAKRMVPDLDTRVVSEWMGHRPTLPDSMPAIGPVPGQAGLYTAFGHSHLGLTGGPLTGQIIADLVAGRAPQVAIEAFSVGRFA